MFEELQYIELSGKKYPIKCDLVVLERIQDEFGDLNEFEDGLVTWELELDENGAAVKDERGQKIYKGKFPDMKAVNTALYLMAREGEEITAEKEKRKPVFLSRNEIVRKADVNPRTLARQLHEEYYRCFHIKNAMTTQSQTDQRREADS